MHAFSFISTQNFINHSFLKKLFHVTIFLQKIEFSLLAIFEQFLFHFVANMFTLQELLNNSKTICFEGNFDTDCEDKKTARFKCF